LHGYAQGNQAIIEDAVGMLLVLTEEVESGKADRIQAAPLATEIALQRAADTNRTQTQGNELF
jgi:hypothetical protein